MYAKSYVKLFALAVCAAPLAAQESDTPPEPFMVARACIHRLTHITHTAVHRGIHRTKQCVMQINRLLEQGEDDRAEQVAQVCANRLNESSASIVQRMVGVGEECTQALQTLSAPPELIEGVQRHVMRGVHVIQTVRENLVNRIREAIGQADENDGDNEVDEDNENGMEP